ncbi:YheC/YheD family endospore coat-associated protein [Neobacillus sp. Marseille-QA0830]
MILFGIMSLDLESEAPYIDEIASLAQSYGMECCRFIPSQINPHTQQVKGKMYVPEANSWMDSEFPVPAILYDRCFYGDDEHSKQCLTIVSWLKDRKDVTFLGYGLPNKLELYHSLKTTNLSPYLPPSQSLEDSRAVLKELENQNKIILKPINGSQGHGIYFLKKSHKTIQVKTEKQQKLISRIFPNEAKFLKWLDSLVTKYPYLMQPYYELYDQNLQPFDVRVLLQKNGQGKWRELGRGLRTGQPGGILSNLSAGGSVSQFSEWISSLPPATSEYIQQELHYILTELPKLLESQFLPLFEIGVDIGIAKNGSIWILDINSKPGRKVLLQTHPELSEILYRAPLLYGRYLSQKEQTERKSIYARTLSH